LSTSHPARPAKASRTISDTADDVFARLAELEETIRAIRFGEVDAVVVNGPNGHQVYTLEGADHPYRVLVEQMHEGTVTLDEDGLIVYSNPQFAAIIGAPEESVTGSQFERFLWPTDSNIFAELTESATVRGHSSGELNLRGTSAEAIPVRLSLAMLDHAGIQNISVMVSDLREEIRNAAIVKEEQLSRLILEQAGEAIVVIDPEGKIIRRSESAKSLGSNSMLLLPFDQIFLLMAPDGPLDARRILESARRGVRIQGLEASVRRTTGGVGALLVSTSPLWSEALELLGCVITLTDITERKRAEDALARQAEELALSNNDLRQFAYSASHDLREPLRQIAVFGELIHEKFSDQLGEEGADLIHHVMESAHRMEKLVKDLLAYLQAADAPQATPAKADANEVIRKTLCALEVQIAETAARIESDPLPVLDVHEVHLTQLLQNLIGNALKYKSEFPPLIRVRAEQIRPMWKFTVEDNGIGIDRDYQAQIFGLFARLHGGNKYSGSGIGLAICQKIVQRYGGKIWVESEPGHGAKFQFTLPGGPL
jgi:PAS domain S-box-containing protein